MESNAVPALTFPHPELTSIEGVPDFAALQQMKRQLFANACAIHSTHGDTSFYVHGNEFLMTF